MSAPIAFESSWKKEEERRELRETRDKILQKTQKKFEASEKRREEARLRGDDTWMLPSVISRIEQENEAQDVKSKKHKKEKKKKDKKEKKRKKHKEKQTGSDDDNDSSDDEDAGDYVWMEMKSTSKTSGKTKPISKETHTRGPQLQRDSWMEAPVDLFSALPTVTREELREKKNKDREQQEASFFDKPGQHSRELNPFWKDGGTGLPENKSQEETNAHSSFGDAGLSWLRKSYDRCQEQANEEGRTLEDVAAQRYGSLEKLETMIMEAERKRQLNTLNRNRNNDRSYVPHGQYATNKTDEPSTSYSKYISSKKDIRNRSRSKSQNRNRSNSPSTKNSKRSGSRTPVRKEMSKWPSRNRSRSPKRHRSRSKSPAHRSKSPRRQSNSQNRNRSRSPRKHRSRSPERHRSRSPEHRSKSPRRQSNLQNRNRSRSPRKHKSRSPGRHRSRSPEERSKSPRKHSRSPRRSKSRSPRQDRFRSGMTSLSKRKSLSGRFMKPDASDDECPVNDLKKSRNIPSCSSTPSWKKKTFQKPSDMEDDDRGSPIEKSTVRRHKDDRAPSWKKKGAPKTHEEEGDDREKRKSSVVSDSHTDSSSDSASSDSEQQDSHTISSSQATSAVSVPAVKPLTEKEMNELGAKIVRAELMGNQTLADDLKSKLDAAREMRENLTSQGVDVEMTPSEPDDNVIVLTRTGRSGMVRPLDDRQQPREAKGGRRKKQKVTTHDKGGERERYFDDDDRFDLKTLVEREKLGTAEDQNSMFARLAGRSVDKLNDDFQMDDMFMERASKKQSLSVEEERERAKAILEHKKLSSALDKCRFCFEKVAKHLIIAIGINSYLCLPSHKSLTDGHCLIVPMQHVPCATATDEDVWNEIQVFRRCLTKMFLEQDQDCVFMETVMRLKKQPHMHIECIPLSREVGDMSPIYFKKAIMEVGSEWAQNKKLVDLSQKDVKRAVPKGFPYFSVDFGLQGGYAHVIEDEQTFPYYFGREVVGGMLDAEPMLWRKPRQENFEDQRQKVLRFSENWKSHDWTQNITKSVR